MLCPLVSPVPLQGGALTATLPLLLMSSPWPLCSRCPPLHFPAHSHYCLSCFPAAAADGRNDVTHHGYAKS
eukprot:gene13018-biopygen16992